MNLLVVPNAYKIGLPIKQRKTTMMILNNISDKAIVITESRFFKVKRFDT